MLKKQLEFKKEVIYWLKEIKHQNRQWLASKCGVNKRTVDNWLSSKRPIPVRAKVLIDFQMKEWRKAEAIREKEEFSSGGGSGEDPVRHVLSLTFSTEELLRINLMANKNNELILGWIKGIVLEKVRSESHLESEAEKYTKR